MHYIIIEKCCEHFNLMYSSYHIKKKEKKFTQRWKHGLFPFFDMFWGDWQCSLIEPIFRLPNPLDSGRARNYPTLTALTRVRFKPFLQNFALFVFWFLSSKVVFLFRNMLVYSLLLVTFETRDRFFQIIFLYVLLAASGLQNLLRL